jgi:hypothetical protein
MKETKAEHFHTLEKVRAKVKRKGEVREVLFRCRAPDCTFTWTKNLLEGKRVRCNSCTELFLLTKYALKLAKPICQNCSNSKSFGVQKDDVVVKAAASGVMHELLDAQPPDTFVQFTFNQPARPNPADSFFRVADDNEEIRF